MCSPLPFGEAAAAGAHTAKEGIPGFVGSILHPCCRQRRLGTRAKAGGAVAATSAWQLAPLHGSWHLCIAYGTSARQLAPLHGTWQPCSAAGTSARCWHLCVASVPPAQSLLQREGRRGKEEGAVPFSPSPDSPTGPCLTPSPAQPPAFPLPRVIFG